MPRRRVDACCVHLPGSTSQLGLKLWLLMSMSGSSAAGGCGPRTLNAREDVAARAQPEGVQSIIIC